MLLRGVVLSGLYYPNNLVCDLYLGNLMKNNSKLVKYYFIITNNMFFEANNSPIQRQYTWPEKAITSKTTCQDELRLLFMRI